MDLVRQRKSLAYSLPDFLHRIIRVCGSKEMLTEEHDFRFSVLEPHQRMLPIANVVPEADVQDLSTEIVAVEVEPKSVNDAMTFVHDYQNGRRIAAATPQWAFV